MRKVPSPTVNVKSAGSMQQVEPNVDFELDIKVTVSSGQCVLHPKESKTLLDYDDPKRYFFLPFFGEQYTVGHFSHDLVRQTDLPLFL